MELASFTLVLTTLVFSHFSENARKEKHNKENNNENCRVLVGLENHWKMECMRLMMRTVRLEFRWKLQMMIHFDVLMQLNLEKNLKRRLRLKARSTLPNPACANSVKDYAFVVCPKAEAKSKLGGGCQSITGILPRTWELNSPAESSKGENLQKEAME
jgi:hypothetical protein